MNTVRISKAAIASITAIVLSIGTISPAFASVQESTERLDQVCADESLDSAQVDFDLVCKMISVGKYLRFLPDGKSLSIKLSDEQLLDEFGFTPIQIQDFHSILNGTYIPPSSYQHSTAVASSEGYRYYISNGDLKAGVFAVLGAAAASGPEALAAAWIGVSSMIGGPVGAAVSGGIALLGAAFFIDLAAKITGALVQGRGVALYLTWGFPPIQSRIE